MMRTRLAWLACFTALLMGCQSSVPLKQRKGVEQREGVGSLCFKILSVGHEVVALRPSRTAQLSTNGVASQHC